MTHRDYSHWARFDVAGRTVLETRSWLVVTRPVQVTLGSCVILLKRPVDRIVDLKPYEMLNLKLAIRRFEILLEHTFHPVKFNYVLSAQSDSLVHFHALPRYDSSRSFQGTEWLDADWPYFLDFPRDAETPEWVVEAVTHRLRVDAIKRRRR